MTTSFKIYVYEGFVLKSSEKKAALILALETTFIQLPDGWEHQTSRLRMPSFASRKLSNVKFPV